MIAYFVTTDRAKAEAEARGHGWVQVAVGRWMTPDRDDLRLITHVRQFTLIPGGSYLLPAADLKDAAPENEQPWRFKQMVESGAAHWVPNPGLGEEGTWKLVDRIKEPVRGSLPTAAEVLAERHVKRVGSRLEEVPEPPEAA